MSLKILTIQFRKVAIASTVLMLAACNITESNTNEMAAVPIAKAEIERISIDRLDSNCYSQVVQRKNSIGSSADAAQQLALAKAATRCIENKSFYPQHPDSQNAMQLSALAVVNYIKAGETQLAEQSLTGFRKQFPKQDLLFADYTSFVDTAVALLKFQTLSAHELQTLNINSSLRTELKRQQYWLRN
ncbi:MAG: hypothetical protein ACI9O6_001331 [Glaciecola sp.]|jgi:hypothetical protein